MRHTPDHLLTPEDAAQYLRIAVATLASSRLTPPRCDGPPYVRYGRAIRYLRADLDAWLAARRVVPAEMDVVTGRETPALPADVEIITR
jgi:hypothetical protein